MTRVIQYRYNCQMALEQFQLDGRVAIVTGAGRGDGGIQTHNSPLVLPEL